MLTQRPLTSSIVKATASKVLSSAPCALTWHDRKLFVRAASLEESLDLEALQDSDRLVECLKRSPVKLVKLDTSLDDSSIIQWAEACQLSGKNCYLDIDSKKDLLIKNKPFSEVSNVLLHKLLAVACLCFLSPLTLVRWLKKDNLLQLEKKWVRHSSGQVFQVLISKDDSESKISFYTRLINVLKGNILLSDNFFNQVQYLENISR